MMPSVAKLFQSLKSFELLRCCRVVNPTLIAEGMGASVPSSSSGLVQEGPICTSPTRFFSRWSSAACAPPQSLLQDSAGTSTSASTVLAQIPSPSSAAHWGPRGNRLVAQIQESSSSNLSIWNKTLAGVTCGDPLPWHNVQLQHVRTLFGAPKPKVNLQIHTHEKYKIQTPKLEYNWMVGRFIIDRDGSIWHKQANSSHKRYAKSASQLTRLRRLKPLHEGFARKFKKLGFNRRFWMDPRPQDVPGFHALGPRRQDPRHCGDIDKRKNRGHPALSAH